MNHGKYIYTIYHFTPANKFKGGAECRCGGGHDVTLLSQLSDSPPSCCLRKKIFLVEICLMKNETF